MTDFIQNLFTDPRAASTDDLADFERAIAGALRRYAKSVTAMNARENFKLSDVEVTCIPEGGRVKVLISTQTEMVLDLVDVADINDGIGSVSASHACLWSGVR